MSRHDPGRLALDAAKILACGLLPLPIFALAFYRAGGPRWPHEVVNGLAWLIVVTAGVMLAVAGAEKLADVARRHLPH